MKGKWRSRIAAGMSVLTGFAGLMPGQAQAAKAKYTYVSLMEKHYVYNSEDDSWDLNNTTEWEYNENGTPALRRDTQIDPQTGEASFVTISTYKYKKKKKKQLASITVTYENTAAGTEPVLDKQTFTYYKNGLLKTHTTKNPGIGKETEKYTYKKKKLRKITVTFDDGTRQVVRLTYKGKALSALKHSREGEDSWVSYQASYDKKGRLKTVRSEEAFSGASSGYTMNYSYNKYGYEKKHSYESWNDRDTNGKSVTKTSYKYYKIGGKRYPRRVTESLDGKKYSQTRYSKPVKIRAVQNPWIVTLWRQAGRFLPE